MKLTPLALALALVTSTGSAHALTVVRVATTHPASSAYGTALQTWSATLLSKTNGALGVSIVVKAGGSVDEEADTASIVRECDGKVTRTTRNVPCDADAAILPVRALSPFVPSVEALGLPGVLTTQGQLDEALRLLGPRLEERLARAGFITVGWIDMGTARPFAAATAGELFYPKERATFRLVRFWNDAPTATFEKITGAIGDLASPSRVRVQLGGAAIFAPAYDMEVMQWAPLVAKVSDLAYARSVGVLVINPNALARMTEAERTLFVGTGRETARKISTNVATLDAASFTRLSARLSVARLNADQVSRWRATAKEVRALRAPIVGADLVAQVETLSGER